MTVLRVEIKFITTSIIYLVELNPVEKIMIPG